MKFLAIFFMILFFSMSFLTVESAYRDDERKEALKAGKKIKHERIQPAGRHIGFVKEKYHDD